MNESMRAEMADRIERQQLALEEIDALHDVSADEAMWIAHEALQEQTHRLLPTLERQRVALERIEAKCASSILYEQSVALAQDIAKIAREARQEQDGG